MKQVVLFVFPGMPQRRTPYLLSRALIPSVFVSVLTSGKWEEWEEVRIRTPHRVHTQELEEGISWRLLVQTDSWQI
jgi:hypothetical protein